MSKNTSVFLALLALAAFNLAYAGEAAPENNLSEKFNSAPKPAVSAGTCVYWKPYLSIDLASLNKLEKNSYSEKPVKGASYTKNQLIVLLGKNPSGAREILANSKNKLTKTADGFVDLRDAELNGFDLSGLNLDNADLKGADMRGANLSNSNLNNAILYKTNVEGANLDHAAINFTNAVKANLVNAHICEATLFYTDIRDASFQGANMRGAKLDTSINIPAVMYLNSHSIFELGMPVPPNYFDQ